MDITPKQWSCINCKILYISKENNPYQVDYIDDQHILVSTYYNQHLLKNNNNQVTLNDCFCSKCVDDITELKYDIEPEPEYTFESSGVTCWDINKLDHYKRDCSDCSQCQNQITLLSLLSIDLNSHHDKNFIIIWTPHLCSLAFHDFNIKKVYTSTIPFNWLQYPSILCQSCFNQQEWNATSGPILCQFCDQTYCRCINQFSHYPSQFSLSCGVHLPDDDKYIYDGLIIEPKLYKWIKCPPLFDDTKPFCLECLTKFVKEGIITNVFDHSDDDILNI